MPSRFLKLGLVCALVVSPIYAWYDAGSGRHEDVRPKPAEPPASAPRQSVGALAQWAPADDSWNSSQYPAPPPRYRSQEEAYQPGDLMHGVRPWGDARRYSGSRFRDGSRGPDSPSGTNRKVNPWRATDNAVRFRDDPDRGSGSSRAGDRNARQRYDNRPRKVNPWSPGESLERGFHQGEVTPRAEAFGGWDAERFREMERGASAPGRYRPWDVGGPRFREDESGRQDSYREYYRGRNYGSASLPPGMTEEYQADYSESYRMPVEYQSWPGYGYEGPYDGGFTPPVDLLPYQDVDPGPLYPWNGRDW